MSFLTVFQGSLLLFVTFDIKCFEGNILCNLANKDELLAILTH